MKIKYGLIKMTLNYLGQLIFLTFQGKVLRKCNCYPPEIFDLPRFNGIITKNCSTKPKNCPPKFSEEAGQ